MISVDKIMLLPTAYFPPISYFTLILRGKEIFIEQMETFPKQTYRNRCEIMSVSGKANLIIPVSKPDGNHTMTKDVIISYRENWQHHHLKTLHTAYRSSPFFEFYIDQLQPIFKDRFERLIDLNIMIINIILKTFNIDKAICLTDDYSKEQPGFDDFRTAFSPKNQIRLEYPPYPQVFSHINGFLPNLSILDLLFNLGPGGLNYLEKITVK